MYIEQKVRVLLMLKKMGSNLTPSEEAFLRSYSGVVNTQLSQLPQHPIDQGKRFSTSALSYLQGKRFSTLPSPLVKNHTTSALAFLLANRAAQTNRSIIQITPLHS
ncbi:UNVERIFIED_CONTAM: hypothetical protein FKN15_014826 [Acipenser sinensis]